MHPLYGYLPDYAIIFVDGLVKGNNVHFKVVAPRKTKLGDCRYPRKKSDSIVITVNQDLPPLQFLVTGLHELAHAQTFRKYGNKVRPHGLEWKNTFSQILLELCDQTDVPENEQAILKSIAKKPSATSYGSSSLQNFTKKGEMLFLKDIPNDAVFQFNNRTFRKIRLLRTHILCSCEVSKKRYRIHGLAQIPAPDPLD